MWHFIPESIVVTREDRLTPASALERGTQQLPHSVCPGRSRMRKSISSSLTHVLPVPPWMKSAAAGGPGRLWGTGWTGQCPGVWSGVQLDPKRQIENVQYGLPLSVPWCSLLYSEHKTHVPNSGNTKTSQSLCPVPSYSYLGPLPVFFIEEKLK